MTELVKDFMQSYKPFATREGGGGKRGGRLLGLWEKEGGKGRGKEERKLGGCEG